MNNKVNKVGFNNCVADKWDGVIKGWSTNKFWVVWIYSEILKCYLDLINNDVNMKDINRWVADEWDEGIKFGLWLNFWEVW